jgi:hypothetical protein
MTEAEAIATSSSASVRIAPFRLHGRGGILSLAANPGCGPVSPDGLSDPADCRKSRSDVQANPS